MNETGPKTLLDAVRHFSDLGVCFRYMVQMKWPDGKLACPKCGHDQIGTRVPKAEIDRSEKRRKKRKKNKK